MKSWRELIIEIFGNSKKYLSLKEIHKELKLSNSALSKMSKKTIEKVLLENSSESPSWRGQYDSFKLIIIDNQNYWAKKKLNSYEKKENENLFQFHSHEGSLKMFFHTLRERNKFIVKKKINEILKKFGKLECEVCDFNFHDFYGQRGKEFIECHHKIPLSKLKPKTITLTKDLAAVCSNCHRMLHQKPYLSIEKLRKKIKE